MSAPLSLSALVTASQVHALQRAIVAALAPLFPEVEVKGHPGKLDISDVLEKDVIRAPAILVAILRQVEEQRLSTSRDVLVEIGLFVVVEDAAFGEPPMRIERDELGHAICDALTYILNGRESSRWNYQASAIGFPDRIEARPLFTALTFERGTAYYTVTFSQTLYNLDPPWDADLQSEPPPPPALDVIYDPPLLPALTPSAGGNP